MFRFITHIPMPGVDIDKLHAFFRANEGTAWLNLLSGGALEEFSVMALGLSPYFTAVILIRLLAPILPALERLAEEGEVGQYKISQYTYWLTVPLAALQGLVLSPFYSEAFTCDFNFFGQASLVAILETYATIAALTAGTMLAVWLGKLINKHGIGNGNTLIILANMLAEIPQNLARVWVSGGAITVVLWIFLIVVLVFCTIVIAQGERRIPVQYGKRVRGVKIYTGGSTHMPVQVLTAGTFPLVLAASFVSLPRAIATYLIWCATGLVRDIALWIDATLASSGVVIVVLYFFFTIGFTYFYTDVMVQVQDLGGALSRQGGFIPGIRPGRKTADFINHTYRRLTLIGAIFLAMMAVFPFLIRIFVRTPALLISGTGLLFVVGAVIDIIRQLESRVLMRQLEESIESNE